MEFFEFAAISLRAPQKASSNETLVLCPAMLIDLFKTCDGFRGESAGCLGFIR